MSRGKCPIFVLWGSETYTTSRFKMHIWEHMGIKPNTHKKLFFQKSLNCVSTHRVKFMKIFKQNFMTSLERGGLGSTTRLATAVHY